MVHMSQMSKMLPTIDIHSAAADNPSSLKDLDALIAKHGHGSNMPATETANAMVDQLVSELGYDHETLDQTEIARSLPAHLRTNHWYCDLHHSMFLILLARAEEALNDDKRALCESYIDTLTIYWILHSLMEEEGMALQIRHDRSCLKHAAAHAQAHVIITKWWRTHVLEPFKSGTASRDDTRRALRAFFNRVVTHIETMDQHAYGVQSPLDERDISREVAHIAHCGLPLSPFMPGCTDVLATLAPRMKNSLAASALAPQAKEPLKKLKLVASKAPLWSGDKGAFRDILARQRGGVHHARSMTA